MKIFNRDGLIAACELLLTAMFANGAVNKFLAANSMAPAQFQGFWDSFVPAYLQTPVLSWTGLSANLLTYLIATFELTLVLVMFYRPKLAAIMVGLVMVGAEVILYQVNQLKRAPSHFLCNNSATCAPVMGLHAFILAVAYFVYMNGAPLCKQCVMAFQSSKSSARNTKNPYATRNRKKNE